ncbi:hypothetical protein [Burkholderia cepacia]|uniref:hypothetical protein n=1 Tax=Burkholderia cepacia TaxID=292 RepID=UPI00158B6FB3|nr:hypothetical protein [Burkholderia cepacia]
MLAIETTTPTISASHSSAAGASFPSRENHENYFDMFLNDLILLSKNLTKHTATGAAAARPDNLYLPLTVDTNTHLH